MIVLFIIVGITPIRRAVPAASQWGTCCCQLAILLPYPPPTPWPFACIIALVPYGSTQSRKGTCCQCLITAMSPSPWVGLYLGLGPLGNHLFPVGSMKTPVSILAPGVLSRHHSPDFRTVGILLATAGHDDRRPHRCHFNFPLIRVPVLSVKKYRHLYPTGWGLGPANLGSTRSSRSRQPLLLLSIPLHLPSC